MKTYEIFKRNFKHSKLLEIFDAKFSQVESRGIDRLSGKQFSSRAHEQLKIASRKCLSGTYKFTPYLELLRAKGRDRLPRIIGIPTIRDRVVLHALKETLSEIFPECVPKKLANTYIHEIRKKVEELDLSEIQIFQTDIENFYDSIDRGLLMEKIRERTRSERILKLICNATLTPIAPKNYRKTELQRYKHSKGIPQGLSISNVLASIYLFDVDKMMRKSEGSQVYYRYVDDILIFTTKNNVEQVAKTLKEEIEGELKLSLSKSKTKEASGSEKFEYLGYEFILPKISVKQSSIDRFINSVAAKFSRYARYCKEESLNEAERVEARKKFVSEVNERITGAISENRRYGWIFYFGAANDIEVFYKIDNIVSSFVDRLRDNNELYEIKKLSRAYHEVLYNPKGGYIHNYDEYKDVLDKRRFLSNSGYLDSQRDYSDEDINKIYDATRSKRLSDLELDDAFLY